MLHSFNRKIEHTGNTVINAHIADGTTLTVKKGDLIVKGNIGRNCIINVEGNIKAHQVGEGSVLTLPKSSNVIVNVPLHGGVIVHKVEPNTVCYANGNCHSVGQKPRRPGY
jgi:hypothetical protein